MPMFEDPHDAVLAVSLDLTTGFAGTFAGPEEVTPVGRFRDQAVGTLSDLPSDLLSVVAWELVSDVVSMVIWSSCRWRRSAPWDVTRTVACDGPGARCSRGMTSD